MTGEQLTRVAPQLGYLVFLGGRLPVDDLGILLSTVSSVLQLGGVLVGGQVGHCGWG